MRISGFTTIRPNQAETRTYEDFMKFLSVNNAQVKSCELLGPLQIILYNEL
jgi:hypothetical protein